MQSAAIARLFASGILKEMARWGKSPLFTAVVRETKIAEHGFDGNRVADLFEFAFAWLKHRSLRDEYVYKSALTHKILLGRHSLDTASMVTEFRVGECKADVVIFNRTGTVYEIKSERDSLSRLVRQIDAFGTVFPLVNVIVGENHLAGVRDSLPPSVGIMVLHPRYRISTVREASSNPSRTSARAIFNSLNMQEAELVLRELGYSISQVPNTKRYDALRADFETLDPIAAHAAMVRVLKKTRTLAPLNGLVDSLPKSLHSLALTTKVRKQDHERLIGAVNTPIDRAMLGV